MKGWMAWGFKRDADHRRQEYDPFCTSSRNSDEMGIFTARYTPMGGKSA